MKSTSKKEISKRQKKQMDQVQAMADHLARQDVEQVRTEAFQTARAIALAGLPKRKTLDRDLVRTLRLGKNLWLRVIYSTELGGILPYGEDRFVLAGIQSLALQHRSPVVFFEEVSELLKMFEISTGGKTLQLFRERFERIVGLAIRLRFAETEEDLKRAPVGESSFVIQKYVLPTKEELICERIGKTSLPKLVPDEDSPRSRYGVVLSPYFWEHLKEPKNRLILPLNLMKLFINNPTGWDYASFLVHRCSRAKSVSVIDHDVLMSLFKDSSKENDRQTIKRLLKCHELVTHSLNGRLNASLEQVGYFPSTGGRPKEHWLLKVGPSHKIVWSGKNEQESTPTTTANT